MSVEIIIPSHLIKYNNGSKSIKLEPSRISDLMQNIKSKLPELSGKLFDESGFLKPYFKLFFDEDRKIEMSGVDVKAKGNITDYDMEIKDGQNLRIVLVVSGG